MLALKTRNVPCAAPVLAEARVLGVVTDDTCLLADGRAARAAASCLLAPEAGDRVLLGEVGKELFVLHVLERKPCGVARLRVPGAAELSIEQEAVAVLAQRRLSLLSLGDVEVSAAQGSLLLGARNLFVTAADSLVENARHRVAQVQHYLLQVKELWRVHSRQGLLTAEGDLKVDAERVSVG